MPINESEIKPGLGLYNGSSCTSTKEERLDSIHLCHTQACQLDSSVSINTDSSQKHVAYKQLLPTRTYITLGLVAPVHSANEVYERH